MYQDDKPNVLFKLVLFLINFYQNLSVKKLSNQNFVWKSFFAIHSNLALKNFTNHTYFFSRVYTKWTAFSHHVFSRAATGSLSMPGRSTSFGKKTRIWCKWGSRAGQSATWRRRDLDTNNPARLSSKEIWCSHTSCPRVQCDFCHSSEKCSRDMIHPSS